MDDRACGRSRSPAAARPRGTSCVRLPIQLLKGVHFELGGNDPAIVLGDADLRASVERIVQSAFRRAGQVCFAIKRMYVPRSVAEEFGRLFVERVDGISVGDVQDERSTWARSTTTGQLAKRCGG